MTPIIELLVLGGIVVFLVLRLRSVLGTRDGFEPNPVPQADPGPEKARRRSFEVIEGGIDRDIADHADPASDAGKALAKMKVAEPGFSVTEFLTGARAAYEMILMDFEAGNLQTLKPFLSQDVFDSFEQVVKTREAEGLHIDATFIGVRELKLADAEFDDATGEGEVTIRFVGELTSVVRDRAGQIVEGNPEEIKRQRDVWTFARRMGSTDPNWQLVATGG
jgi:predicted lipid-binding transport protein (Tim44 family)